MRKLGVVLAALCLASLALAQTETAKPAPSETEKYYRLDFTVKDLEAGKVVTSHDYSISMATNQSKAEIRSGEKVPVNGQVPVNTMYQDVGTNIDSFDLKQQGDRLSLRISAEVTSAVKIEGVNLPLLRQTRWNAYVLISPRRPTVVFSSDNPTSNGRMQMEVTATPVN